MLILTSMEYVDASVFNIKQGTRKDIKIKRKKRGGKNSDERCERREGPLAEFEAEAESQLVLLDPSVSVDVTVTHHSFPELVQVCATDAGLHGGEGRGGSEELGQRVLMGTDVSFFI